MTYPTALNTALTDLFKPFGTNLPLQEKLICIALNRGEQVSLDLIAKLKSSEAEDRCEYAKTLEKINSVYEEIYSV